MAQRDLLLALRLFAADTIVKEQWFRAPVKVELLDVGFSPVCEMEARKEDDQSSCEFPLERWLWRGAVNPRGPLRVRFTYEGKTFPPRDFPES